MKRVERPPMPTVRTAPQSSSCESGAWNGMSRDAPVYVHKYYCCATRGSRDGVACALVR